MLLSHRLPECHLVLLGYAAVAIPSGAAMAEDLAWCVNPGGMIASGWLPPGTSGCYNTSDFSDVADALEAIDADHLEHPGEPTLHHIIAIRGQGVLGGEIVLNNSAGVFGDDIEFLLEDPDRLPVCGAIGDSPAIQVVGIDRSTHPERPVTHVHWSGLSAMPSQCGSSPGPVFALESAYLTLDAARIHGGSGTLIQADSTHAETTVEIVNSRIGAWEGSVVAGDASVTCRETEVAGSHVIGGGALLQAGGRGESRGVMTTSHCAFVGNVVEEGGSVLHASGRMQLEASYLVGNVVVGGGPLAFFPSAPSEVSAQFFSGLLRSVVADNVLLAASGQASAGGEAERPREVLQAGQVCWPIGSDGRSLGAASSPTWSGPPGEGPLFRIGASPTNEGQGRFAIVKSSISGTVQGSGAPLLAYDGPTADEVLLVVHSNVGLSGSTLLDPGPASPGRRFTLGLVRNLFSGSALLADGRSDAMSLEVTMNTAIGGLVEEDLEGMPGLLGPNFSADPELPATPFVPAFALAGASECGLAAYWFEEAGSDCSGVQGRAVCPTGTAVELLLDPTLAAALARPWPWTGDLMPTPAPTSTRDLPGMAGWTISATIPADVAGSTGDHDQYSNLTDCDNEDPDEFPVLPSWNGYTQPWCDASDGKCFQCPAGSELPPPPSSGGLDEPSASQPPARGCGETGCGIPFSCAGRSSSQANILPLVTASVLVRLRHRSPPRPRRHST